MGSTLEPIRLQNRVSKDTEAANADVLSRFPANVDAQFDREEAGEDTEMVCTIETVSNKVTQQITTP